MRKRKLLTLFAVTMVIAMAGGSALAELATGVTVNFDASDPASGVSSTNWNSLTADDSSDWVFGADVTLEEVNAACGGIDKAYRFTGGDGAQTSSYSKYRTEPDFFTIEIWLKPSDTGADSQIVFETGAGFRGMAVWYSKGTDNDGIGTINFTVDDGSNYDTVSAEINTFQFTQVTGVYSRNIDADGTDLLEIYIDGALAAENRENTGINNWGGGNAAGLASTLTAACSGVPSDSGGFDGDISIFRFWEGKGLSAAEIAANFDLVLYPAVAAVYPLNNGVSIEKSPDPVILEWLNLDPNSNDAATTYVDVWFGTDPNKNSGNYTKVVDGKNVQTYLTGSLAPGIYYWQVDSYLNGDPANTNYGGVGEPNMVPGRIYTFTNDGPVESVNLNDVVTLPGLTVPLSADVVDDGGSTLSYSWTVGEAPGVTATISDPTAAVTDVTFTRGTYLLPYLENTSFEDPVLADGSQTAIGWGTGDDYTTGNLPPWKSAWKQTAATDWNFHTWRGGAYNPTDEEYAAIPDGENVAWVTASSNPDYEHCVYTQTSLTIEAGKTYALSAMAGSRLTHASSNDHRIEIAGLGVAATSGSVSAPAPGEWVTTSISFTPAEGDPNIGEPLTIRLVSEGGSSTTGPDFDKVVFTVDGVEGSVEYDMLSAVNVTAAVQDETNPAVTGSMTVYIYEDGCTAAKDGLGLDAVYLADFDKSCIVGSEDLFTFAKNWLNNIAYDVPQTVNDATVYNGDFEILYKTDTKIAGQVSSGGWSQGVGPDCPIDSGQYVFSDGTTDIVADISGWLGYDKEGWIAAGGSYERDQTTGNLQGAVTAQNNATPDGTQCFLVNGGGWGNSAGGLIVSEVPVGFVSDGTYTLSMVAQGSAEPVVLKLLAGDQEVTPTSSVDPLLEGGVWNEFSRTYDPNDTDLGKPLKIVLGVGRGATGDQTRFDDVTLLYQAANADMPTVDAGGDIISWSGEPITMNPNVINNDTQDPQRGLSYFWTAETVTGLTVDISDPTAEAPTVTITKAEGTPDTDVMLTLAVTLEGSTAVYDVLRVTVFDDACEAIMVSDPSMEFEVTDISQDCETNIVDFAELAAQWLEDYTVTEPTEIVE